MKLTVFKTYAELEKAYWEHYVELEYNETTDSFNVDEVSYHLDEENEIIIQNGASGSAECGCDMCYSEWSEVVAGVELPSLFIV